jgi:hypothetical protein
MFGGITWLRYQLAFINVLLSKCNKENFRVVSVRKFVLFSSLFLWSALTVIYISTRGETRTFNNIQPKSWQLVCLPLTALKGGDWDTVDSLLLLQQCGLEISSTTGLDLEQPAASIPDPKYVSSIEASDIESLLTTGDIFY